MPIEVLITLTYTAATLFMMSLCWGIGFVTAIRRVRLGRSESRILKPAQTVPQQFRVIGQQLGEWREWSEKQRDNTNRIETNVVMPMRYQQPQLFADPSIDTKPERPEVRVKVG